MLPCAGQGALAIETRGDDAALHRAARIADRSRHAPRRRRRAGGVARSRRQLQHAARRARRRGAAARSRSTRPSAIPRTAPRRCCARARPARSATSVPPRHSAVASPRRCLRPARRRTWPPPNDSAPAPTCRDHGSDRARPRHAPGRAGRAVGRASCAQRGIAAEALPLIEIAPARGCGGAARGVGRSRGVPAGRLRQRQRGAALLRRSGRPSAAWPGRRRRRRARQRHRRRAARCRRAARAIVTPAADAAQFDSESLWARLQARDWRGARVLVVRGDGGRDWLGERLVAAGAQRRHGERVSTPRRRASPVPRAIASTPRSPTPMRSGCSAARRRSPTSSRRPAPGRFAAARAVATHPRIAARARGLGFAVVVEAAPGLDAVIACLQSIQP